MSHDADRHCASPPGYSSCQRCYTCICCICNNLGSRQREMMSWPPSWKYDVISTADSIGWCVFSWRIIMPYFIQIWCWNIGIAMEWQTGAIDSPKMPKNTFSTKRCAKFLHLFSAQNLAREAYSSLQCPPPQDKFLATPVNWNNEALGFY